MLLSRSVEPSCQQLTIIRDVVQMSEASHGFSETVRRQCWSHFANELVLFGIFLPFLKHWICLLDVLPPTSFLVPLPPLSCFMLQDLKVVVVVFQSWDLLVELLALS